MLQAALFVVGVAASIGGVMACRGGVGFGVVVASLSVSLLTFGLAFVMQQRAVTQVTTRLWASEQLAEQLAEQLGNECRLLTEQKTVEVLAEQVQIGRASCRERVLNLV